jgi:hypothetical protein
MLYNDAFMTNSLVMLQSLADQINTY